MANGCSYKERISLDIARTREMRRVPTSGYAKIVDSSDSSLQITVGVDRESGNAAEFNLKRTGEIVDLGGFDRLYITNTITAGGWIDLICSQSKEDFDVNKGDLGVINSITDPVVTHGGNTRTAYPHTAGVAAQQVFAANAARTSWTFYNNGSVVVYLIKDAAQTVADGIPIQPGQLVSDTDTAALWSISGAAAQNCRVMEVTKV